MSTPAAVVTAIAAAVAGILAWEAAILAIPFAAQSRETLQQTATLPRHDPVATDI